MPAIDQRLCNLSTLLENVAAGIGGAASVQRDAGEIEKSRQAWRKLIEDNLTNWGRNPRQFEDEGVTPPSQNVISLAIELARALEKAGSPPPDSVVPDANGGIVFERRHENVSDVYHIWDDGSIDYQRFDGTRLVERRTL
jgi:hypothetical protein